MDKRMQYLTSQFDFTKMGCHCKDCKSKKTSAFVVYEDIVEKKRRRGLANLTLCKDHIKLVEGVVAKLEKMSDSSVIIGSEIQE